MRDPVQAEGAHLAAARVESGGIPPPAEGDNAVRLEHPFGGLVLGAGQEPRPQTVPEIVLEPTDMPWGNRSVILTDPDGGLVNLFTPVTPEAKAKYGL